MPKRQAATRRIEGGPQGDDAYVVLRRLTWGEQEDVQRRVQDITRAGQVEQSEQSRALLANVVIEWNWVADEMGEQPLAQPEKNPDAFKPLMDNEVTWLMAQISGQDTEEKKVNSPTT